MSGFSVLIPARMASSRLPNKPLADIAGKPMIVRVAEQAAKSQARQVVVATDHEAVYQACQAHHISVMMTQSHHVSGSDRLAEAVQLLQLGDRDIVVNVQGDEPLMNPDLINDLAQLLQQSTAPMATLAHPLHAASELFNPNIVKVVLDHSGRALYFSRAPIPYARDAFATRQDQLPAELPVLRHIGMYAYRAGFLKTYSQLAPAPLEQFEALEQLRVLWHGYAIMVATTDQPPAAGVDTAEDLQRVRQLWADS